MTSAGATGASDAGDWEKFGCYDVYIAVSMTNSGFISYDIDFYEHYCYIGPDDMGCN